jgi:hypothetical protein
MICRALRSLAWRWLAPGVGLWLVACGWLLALPADLASDTEPLALAPLTRSHPLTALAENSGVRLEKPAQSHRTSLKRPGLGGCLPRPTTLLPVTASAQRRQPRWDLPRRHLAVARLIPCSADGSVDPFPS